MGDSGPSKGLTVAQMKRIAEKTGCELDKVAECPVCRGPVTIACGELSSLADDWDYETSRRTQEELCRNDVRRLEQLAVAKDRARKLELQVLELQTPMPGPACDMCGREVGMEFTVSPEAWAAVATEDMKDGGGYLCVWCFDMLALRRGIEYWILDMCFVGRAGSGSDAKDYDERMITLWRLFRFVDREVLDKAVERIAEAFGKKDAEKHAAVLELYLGEKKISPQSSQRAQREEEIGRARGNRRGNG